MTVYKISCFTPSFLPPTTSVAIKEKECLKTTKEKRAEKGQRNDYFQGCLETDVNSLLDTIKVISAHKIRPYYLLSMCLSTQLPLLTLFLSISLLL